MLSLGSLLTHQCHSHLVAHDHICKAMLITIVTRALFLAGSVPPGCVAGRGHLHGARLAVVASRGHACVSMLFPSVPPAPPCPPPAGFSPGFSPSPLHPLQLSAHRGHAGDPSSALRKPCTSRVKAVTFGAATASLVASGASLVSALD